MNIVNVLENNLLFQHINKPTRNQTGQISNILDLVISNNPDHVQAIEHLAPIGKSDHDSLYILTAVVKNKENSNATKPNYKNADFSQMKKDVKCINMLL